MSMNKLASFVGAVAVVAICAKSALSLFFEVNSPHIAEPAVNSFAAKNAVAMANAVGEKEKGWAYELNRLGEIAQRGLAPNSGGFFFEVLSPEIDGVPTDPTTGIFDDSGRSNLFAARHTLVRDHYSNFFVPVSIEEIVERGFGTASVVSDGASFRVDLEIGVAEFDFLNELVKGGVNGSADPIIDWAGELIAAGQDTTDLVIYLVADNVRFRGFSVNDLVVSGCALPCSVVLADGLDSAEAGSIVQWLNN